MIHDQNLPDVTAGVYSKITAPIYLDDTNTTMEDELAQGVVSWHLKGPLGDLILKTSDTGGGITVDLPEQGWITIQLDAMDTTTIASGTYYHHADFLINDINIGLFDGSITVVNNTGATFTQASDIQAYLGVSVVIQPVILRQCDAWVRTQMRANGIGIPPLAKTTEDMQLAGAMIGCAFVIRSHESDKSWWQSINIAGASVTMGDAEQRWETAAKEIITAMAASVQPLFATTVYDDQNYEYS